MLIEVVREAVEKLKVIPVVAIDDVNAAIPLADALIAGGLPIAEITFRTTVAAEVMKKISAERPQLLLGAGTVLSAADVETAKVCGAKFAVAPGLNPAVVTKAQEVGLPFMPGVATPSEIEQGLALGCALLKFFPAEALGGVGMLQALAAPYAHKSIKFMPTGGVNLANLESYLALPSVAAVGGTWIATKSDIAEGQWETVAARCKAATEIARKGAKLT